MTGALAANIDTIYAVYWYSEGLEMLRMTYCFSLRRDGRQRNLNRGADQKYTSG